jgi:LysR family transcriptional activator of nhaA
LEPTDLGRTVFRYADQIFRLGGEMMDTIRGNPATGPLSLRVGIVPVVPKLIVRKILEPVFELPEKVHLLCHEDNEDNLLGELAVHKLDVVLSDAPLRKGLHVKAYNHLLGECGVTFLAVKNIAKTLRKTFPESLDRTPMLVPVERTALRQGLERWLDTLNVRPVYIGEFEDSALLKAFGQHGDGVFMAPWVVEAEIRRQYGVDVVGRTEAIRERFYAISCERIVKHPAVTAISAVARDHLFAPKQTGE